MLAPAPNEPSAAAASSKSRPGCFAIPGRAKLSYGIMAVHLHILIRWDG